MSADVGFLKRKIIAATKPDIIVEVNGNDYVITTVTNIRTIRCRFCETASAIIYGKKLEKWKTCLKTDFTSMSAPKSKIGFQFVRQISILFLGMFCKYVFLDFLKCIRNL
jgi:hypothetical protein